MSTTPNPSLLPEVAQILDVLLTGAQHVLGHNLVGVYLRGSLAFGDFIPATSDVDVLGVTERPADVTTFDRLATLHAHIAALPNPFATRLEVAYINRRALKRFQAGQRHPTLGQGETLTWQEHHANWVLERWTVREHGIPLLGPAPQKLIDPISAGELRQAVASRLQDWAAWAQTPDDPDWRLPRSHKAYVVETMCRALYTLVHGRLVSKPQAVVWAREVLPEPWRSTVERSQQWRTDSTIDLTLIPEVRDFVLWAAAQSPDTG